MNKIFSSLLTVCVLTLFVACSEDEEAAVATEASLVGNWTIQSAEINDVTINDKDVVDYMIEVLEMSQEEAEAYKVAIEEEMGTESGMTVKIKSDHTLVSEEPGEDPDEGTWKLISDGKKLLIDEGTDDEMEFDIKAISGNNLSLSNEMSEKIDFDQDKIDDILKIKMTINLTK